MPALDAPPAYQDFLLDPSDIRLVMGPRREWKSSAAITAWLLEGGTTPAEALPYKVLTIRDTWTNIKRSTMDTLKEFQARGLAVQFHEGEVPYARLGGGLVDMYFMGMDQAKDLSKFQGVGAAGLHIVEPAPAAVNDIGVGLPPEVLGVGLTSLSQPGCRHRVIIEMNPPDEDHWTVKLGEQVTALRRKTGTALTFKEFRIPKGANPWISDEDRAKWRAGLELIGRGDLVQRLSEGVPGFVVQGEVAFPEYSEHAHVAAEPLEPLRPGPICILLDFGLTPVAIFSQVTPLGHWRLFDAVAGEGMGLEELLEIHALPWLRRYLGPLPEWRFRYIGGPEALVKEQGSGVEIYHTLNKVLGTAVSYEAGPIGWEARMRAGKRVLNRLVSGRPLVQVDPDAKLLRRMFRGGAHFPKDSNGQVVRTKAAMARVSGIFDDLVDAFCHGADVLFPVIEGKAVPPRERVARTVHSWQGR